MHNIPCSKCGTEYPATTLVGYGDGQTLCIRCRMTPKSNPIIVSVDEALAVREVNSTLKEMFS